MSATLHARRATPADAPVIAQIYNQGIADRVATFETSPRSAEDVRAWFDGAHPIVVVEDEPGNCRLRIDLDLPAARVLRRHRRVLGVCRPRGSAAAAPAGWRWKR